MNSDKSRQGYGLCALTGTPGKFVEAHILPKALTRPERPGAPLIQRRSGRRPVRRWTSWYDANLVTADGEKILAGYDDWAIRELRRHKLVWSGWGGSKSLEAKDFTALNSTPWGMRRISEIDTQHLRLFFLSLLWRAAASGLVEFHEVQLSADTMEALRKMVELGDASPVNFLPISLTQISTLGVIHNQGIFHRTKTLPGLPGLPVQMRRYYRIYIDGLIAHVHLDQHDPNHIRELGIMMLGSEADCVLTTVTFERSFELENMLWIHAESLP
jgi:hypothetical protein